KSWQAETIKTGPKVEIITPAPMPTATRARFYPGEDRSALTSCDSEATRIITTLDLFAKA
ncbi:oxidoreductase, partial [Planktomarina sp.]|nr:oxidoreductase [Planktomarina sp.]